MCSHENLKCVSYVFCRYGYNAEDENEDEFDFPGELSEIQEDEETESSENSDSEQNTDNAMSGSDVSEDDEEDIPLAKLRQLPMNLDLVTWLFLLTLWRDVASGI